MDFVFFYQKTQTNQCSQLKFNYFNDFLKDFRNLRLFRNMDTFPHAKREILILKRESYSSVNRLKTRNATESTFDIKKADNSINVDIDMWKNHFFKHESFANLFDKTKRFSPIRASNNTNVLHNKRFLFFLTLSLGSLNNIPVQKAMRKTFIGRSLAHRWPTFLHGIAAFHHVLFIRIHSWTRIHTSSFFRLPLNGYLYPILSLFAFRCIPI